MSQYDYPPSQQIRQYEPFEPNSHFYARGRCHFYKKEYPCDFEVVYTLDGEIYVVCYLGSKSLNELFGIRVSDDMPWEMYMPREERVVVDFSGVDIRSGLQIRVSQAISLENGLSLAAWISNRAPVFVANTFEVSQTDKYYISENKPSSDSIDFELLNVSDTVATTKGIPFRIGGAYVLYLKPAVYTENELNSEENTILTIPRKSVPVGWSAEDVADIWCSSISMATGRDIRWIVKHSYTSRAITHKFKRRSNIVRNRSANGVITSRHDFWRDNNVLALISTVFDKIRHKRVSVGAVRDYSRIMWHFVEYRLITNRVEDQARLITTTVEELLTRWEEHTGNTAAAIVSEAEAKLIWEDLQQRWLPNIESLLGSLTKQRRNEIKSRLQTSFLEEMVRPGFGKRLKQMLERGQNDEAWIKDHAKHRVNSFVTTRNKIAHEGRFPTEDTEELLSYYYDMLMVLPLLIFSIFGYRGTYVDLAREYREFYERKKNRQAIQTSDR